MAERQDGYKRPLPRRRGMAGEFYDFCKQHELRFQRCTDCGTWRHVPREMCAKCGSFNWEWAQSSRECRPECEVFARLTPLVTAPSDHGGSGTLATKIVTQQERWPICEGGFWLGALVLDDVCGVCVLRHLVFEHSEK